MLRFPNHYLLIVLLFSVLVSAGEKPLSAGIAERGEAVGPLRVHPDNPRYFTDGSGRAIYLTGAHTWNNLVDMGPSEPPPAFDFDAYLERMTHWNHNFVRLWTWELLTWDTRQNGAALRKNHVHRVTPHPWLRSGPGPAVDGKARFDLTKLDPSYFERLRRRVKAAGERGIYVSVMLFEGWGIQFSPGAWENHPLHPKNNINGIDGDANKDGRGLEVHTLTNPKVTALQETYVRQIIDSLNDLDNVLYEISNENHPASTDWQYHFIRFIHDYEKSKPKQHPVGMTFQYRGGKNATLLGGPADWISPNHEGGFRDNPPVADGKKVILTDTDHLWGVGGNSAWVWKSFLRGHNPIFMDPYDGVVLGKRFEGTWEPVRRSMGDTLRFAKRMNLAEMTPRKDVASTGYCLAANSDNEFLVYLPSGGRVTLDLRRANGKLVVEWFEPATGKTIKANPIDGGVQRRFDAPWKGDAVLYLKSIRD